MQDAGLPQGLRSSRLLTPDCWAGMSKTNGCRAGKLVWYAHGDWEGNGSSDSLSIFIDMEFGQAIT